ncbi:alpha-protein kinase 1-like [Malaclemys terrapin pileata]|uniref:alpha-protein kinase 1-like n=1 Tax=Malaclemys terrapin pileata TaxID=2991368 RepID=UPI0023A79FB7|nr:alpha-protein kinase 1-like [Malaclemys terrapin pileata]
MRKLRRRTRQSTALTMLISQTARISSSPSQRFPYQPSPGVNPDPESGEGSVVATVSRPTLASPSQRLAQIRRRKKRTRDDMFSELMGCSRADAAQQTQWRENISQYQQAHREREERWQQEDQQATQTLLGLMREQTETLRRFVDVLQDRRQEDRAPLQSISNRPPLPQTPIPPSPKVPRRRGSRGRENCHSTAADCTMCSSITKNYKTSSITEREND